MKRDKEICAAAVVNLPKKMVAGPSWFVDGFPAGTIWAQLGIRPWAGWDQLPFSLGNAMFYAV